MHDIQIVLMWTTSNFALHYSYKYYIIIHIYIIILYHFVYIISVNTKTSLPLHNLDSKIIVWRWSQIEALLVTNRAGSQIEALCGHKSCHSHKLKRVTNRAVTIHLGPIGQNLVPRHRHSKSIDDMGHIDLNYQERLMCKIMTYAALYQYLMYNCDYFSLTRVPPYVMKYINILSPFLWWCACLSIILWYQQHWSDKFPIPIIQGPTFRSRIDRRHV